MNFSSSVAIGPAGVSAEYSRDIFGRESHGVGAASGAELGCMGAIVFTW